MLDLFKRAGGLLVLLAALAACSGGVSPTTPTASSVIPSFERPSGVNSVVITVVDGAKKVTGAKTLLFICSDKPNCLRRDKVLSRGTTNAKGQSTLKGSFTASDFTCALANWTGSSGSITFDRTRSQCSNNFPKAVTINFSGP